MFNAVAHSIPNVAQSPGLPCAAALSRNNDWGHPLVGPCQQACFSPAAKILSPHSLWPLHRARSWEHRWLRALVVGLAVSRQSERAPVTHQDQGSVGETLSRDPRRPLAACAAPDNDRYPAVSKWREAMPPRTGLWLRPQRTGPTPSGSRQRRIRETPVPKLWWAQRWPIRPYGSEPTPRRARRCRPCDSTKRRPVRPRTGRGLSMRDSNRGRACEPRS